MLGHKFTAFELWVGERKVFAGACRCFLRSFRVSNSIDRFLNIVHHFENGSSVLNAKQTLNLCVSDVNVECFVM